MKKLFLLIITVFAFAGCKDILTEELKNAPVDTKEPDVTYGAVFESVFEETVWTSSTDKDGTAFVTVEGLFDWKEGAGQQKSAFVFAKENDGTWTPVSLTVGEEEIRSPFSVGISFLFICGCYKENQIRAAADEVADAISAESAAETGR